MGKGLGQVHGVSEALVHKVNTCMNIIVIIFAPQISMFQSSYFPFYKIGKQRMCIRNACYEIHIIDQIDQSMNTAIHEWEWELSYFQFVNGNGN